MSGSGISWAICKPAPRSRQTTTPTPHHSFFTGRMPFLPPNQQRQSTEGKCSLITADFTLNDWSEYPSSVSSSSPHPDDIPEVVRKRCVKSRDRSTASVGEMLPHSSSTPRRRVSAFLYTITVTELRQHSYVWQKEANTSPAMPTSLPITMRTR